mgnify:CR=1 FL=1
MPMEGWYPQKCKEHFKGMPKEDNKHCLSTARGAPLCALTQNQSSRLSLSSSRKALGKNSIL